MKLKTKRNRLESAIINMNLKQKKFDSENIDSKYLRLFTSRHKFGLNG